MGVADEDMFNKAMKVMDNNAKGSKPFFTHIMTVSNHRPFTYPEGKIDISPYSKSRDGGVKYTDYAIGEFFKKAKTKEWVKNTVFIIVGDHCASSAGKEEVPISNYHIPAFVYSPSFITQKREDRVMSQIDLIPTVLGILNINNDYTLFGQDVYSPSYKPRAFVATYQNLGFYQNDILTVLSPVEQVKQYDVNTDYTMKIRSTIDTVNLNDAIANYEGNSIFSKLHKPKVAEFFR